MTQHERELLRPEDATSWEEFKARCMVAQARTQSGSWKDIILILVSVIPGFSAIAFWYVVAHTSGTALVMALIIAVICTGLFAWPFGIVMRKGARGARRYMELSRLRKQWQARATRGQIPLTTPGGPKVWRDELDTGVTRM